MLPRSRPLAPATSGTLGAPIRVLLVEDDERQRCLLCEILRSCDYCVVEVDTATGALAALGSECFDVVVLDKLLPDLDGSDVIRQVRQGLGDPLLPIIMITGNATEQDLVEGLHLGANDFLPKPFAPGELIARIEAAARYKRITDQMEHVDTLLFTLARMVEAKDECSGDHCGRLAHICTVFGEALELDPQQICDLRRGGVLHDIGKLGIPDSILLKNAPLNDAEWALMRQHTVIGDRLLARFRSMAGVRPIVRSHHERWDGSGYPDGLKGEAIPLLARVLQIADIYDALSSERPYKPAFSREQIISILNDEVARGWRDPRLMRVFMEILMYAPERLHMDEQPGVDLGASAFDEIAATGVIDWDRPAHGQIQQAKG